MEIDRVRNNTIIILDTNALFVPFRFKLNLDSELNRLFGDYQIIIPSCVFGELKRLSSTEKFGAMALELAKKKRPPKWYTDLEEELLFERNRNGMIYDHNFIDNEILFIAKSINGIVLTNDKEFLKKLKSEDIKTISLRGRKYFKPNFKL